MIDKNLVIKIESGGNPLAFNSGTKARGLMQITPIALKEWNNLNPGRQYKEKDLFVPEVNTEIGTWLLDQRIPKMLNTYKIPINAETVLASYNWGIGNVKNWHRRGADPEELPEETQNYLSKYSEFSDGSKNGSS